MADKNQDEEFTIGEKIKFKSQKINIKSTDKVKVFSAIAYVPFLWLIGLVVEDNQDKSLRYHLNQGLKLNIAFFGAMTIVAIFNELFVMFLRVALFFSVLMSVTVQIALVCFIGIGIYNVCKSQEKTLPIIGNIGKNIII